GCRCCTPLAWLLLVNPLFLLYLSSYFGGLNKYDAEKGQESQGLGRFWHDYMAWHGPVGVGSAIGLDEFKQNAQGPIVGAFPDRRGPGHQARIGEGAFAASTGWPSLVGTHVNPYMDWPPTGERIGWNIMDFWKRDGDKLAENWVMIDLIGAAKSSGVDLLARLNV
ncbi:MAG: ester cyclase, partial [Chloroflexota bacterium]